MIIQRDLAEKEFDDMKIKCGNAEVELMKYRNEN